MPTENEDPLKKLTDLINDKFDRSDARLDAIDNRLGAKIDTALAQSTQNSINIAKLNQELAELRSRTAVQPGTIDNASEQRLRIEMEASIGKLSKEIHQANKEGTMNKRGTSSSVSDSNNSKLADQYWDARRKLRCSPITGPDSVSYTHLTLPTILLV